MTKNNVAAYESATQGLLSLLNSMGLPQVERMQAKNFILLFRDSFKLDYVKKETFAPVIGDAYKYFPYPSYGFCKASSSAFVTLMQNCDWQLMYIDEKWLYGPHYFVMHVPTNTVLDLTFDQYAYDGVPIPYKMGTPIKISRETQDTMRNFLDATGLDYQIILNNKKHKVS